MPALDLGSVADVAGIVVSGVAVVGWVSLWVVRLRARRVLGLGAASGLDLVLTTSNVDISHVGAKVARPLTGLGQIVGANACAMAVARYYRHKTLEAHLSVDVRRSQLDRDLVMLGGPAKNQVTRRFLDVLAERRDLALEFDDVNRCLRVGSLGVDDYDVELDPDGRPRRDLALIAAVPNPFGRSGAHRALCCAGFTSYGTGEGARLLFEDLPRVEGRPSEVGWYRRYRWPTSYLAVVEILDPGTHTTRRKLLTLIDLKGGSVVFDAPGVG